MSKALCVLALLLAFSGLASAQTFPPNADWQKVRDAQPAGLHVKMTLAKDHFYQGEKIETTLEFSNDDAQNPYSLSLGAGEPGAIFTGWDAQGATLPNPRQWLEWEPIMIEGPVAAETIGQYKLIRPANDDIRFDKPGTYQIYAKSSLTKGTNPFNNSNPTRVELVSDPVTITITPLSPDQEAQAIAAAKQKIGTPAQNYFYGNDAGIEELCFLQTPAALTELVSMLGDPKLGSQAGTGLESAPDPPSEADQILAAVKSGKVTLDDNGISLYAELKLSRIYIGKSPKDFTEKQREDIMAPRMQILADARKEITDAQLAASGTQGPAHVEALWTAFKEQAIYKNPGEPDKDGGKARAALAEHQLELPPEHVKQLFEDWTYWGSADFLPLVQQQVKAGTDAPMPLIMLAKYSPKEARPLIIADFSSPDPELLQLHYPASILLPDVTPMPLPKFDDLFRKKLTQGPIHFNPFPVIPVINAFGSAKLLPDMIDAYQKHANQMDDAIKQNLFLYWLRADPKTGNAAFQKEIQSRGKEGWAFFLQTLRTSWRKDARPTIDWALNGDDPELASDALLLLKLHGTDADIAPMLTAMERLNANKDYAHSITTHAQDILTNPKWHPTADQKKRLEVLAPPPPAATK